MRGLVGRVRAVGHRVYLHRRAARVRSWTGWQPGELAMLLDRADTADRVDAYDQLTPPDDGCPDAGAAVVDYTVGDLPDDDSDIVDIPWWH